MLSYRHEALQLKKKIINKGINLSIFYFTPFCPSLLSSFKHITLTFKLETFFSPHIQSLLYRYGFQSTEWA